MHSNGFVKPTTMARIAVDKMVTLYIGGVHASQEPIMIKTLLGSCIAACLYDPERRVGGMNHFMLPQDNGLRDRSDHNVTRFGVHAMDRLIAAVMKVGGERRRLVAKVFGGAHVLGIGDSQSSIPCQNIAFIRTFLKKENFPVISEDVGGYDPREVRFLTETGQVLVRQVANTRAWRQLMYQEKIEEAKPPTYGEVTLFQKD
jgi:chemotaxis receptor (MCP) glutamine deamidase CheD